MSSNPEDLKLISSLRRELDEVRRELRDGAEEIGRLRKALHFYLDDDRRAVDVGTLESVGGRPAYEALGGRPSGICSAHQIPSKTCRACYPSPARPRVVPAPPRERETRP